jgi:hypothetical protein
MKKPEISIYGSAHRPQNWMDLYRSIGDNDISFEVIFVGPNEPDFKLPSNFKFIKSYTKPTQCIEIASRNTTADLIIQMADDCEFGTKRPLDMLYNTYKSYNNDKLILSCRYMLNKKIRPNSDHRFFSGDNSSPVMPLSGLMSKKLYGDIGGIDRNFIAVMFDLDIAMRVLALGGEVILSDVYLDELKSKSAGSNLCAEFWSHDRKLLENLWSVDRKTHFNRIKPVEPFFDYKVLEESQGPRGRWHGTSPVILENLVDFLRLNRVCRAIRDPARYLNYAKRTLKRIFH